MRLIKVKIFTKKFRTYKYCCLLPVIVAIYLLGSCSYKLIGYNNQQNETNAPISFELKNINKDSNLKVNAYELTNFIEELKLTFQLKGYELIESKTITTSSKLQLISFISHYNSIEKYNSGNVKRVQLSAEALFRYKLSSNELTDWTTSKIEKEFIANYPDDTSETEEKFFQEKLYGQIAEEILNKMTSF